MLAVTSKAYAQAGQADNYLRHANNDNIDTSQLQIPCRGEKYMPCIPDTGEYGFHICRPFGENGNTAQLNICAPTLFEGVGLIVRPTDYCGCCYAVCPDTSDCTCPCTNRLGEGGIRMVEQEAAENFPNRDLSFCAAGSHDLGDGTKVSLSDLVD